MHDIKIIGKIVDSKKKTQEYLLIVPDRYEKNLTESMYVFNASMCYSNY